MGLAAHDGSEQVEGMDAHTDELVCRDEPSGVPTSPPWSG